MQQHIMGGYTDVPLGFIIHHSFIKTYSLYTVDYYCTSIIIDWRVERLLYQLAFMQQHCQVRSYRV